MCQSTPHFFNSIFLLLPCTLQLHLQWSSTTVSLFSPRYSAGRHVWSAWEVFSHLPGSGAEVNLGDLLFSGTIFGSLTCGKVSITLLVVAGWSADPLTTVKGMVYSWLCETTEHYGAEEKSTFQLIVNQQLIRYHRSRDRYTRVVLLLWRPTSGSEIYCSWREKSSVLKKPHIGNCCGTLPLNEGRTKKISCCFWSCRTVFLSID